MTLEVRRLLVLAVASNLSCDEAYSMLHDDFINAFGKYYSELPEGPSKPTALDALIQFTADELPRKTKADSSIFFELQAKRSTIIRTLLTCNTSTLITDLASRDAILERVRAYLKRENMISSMYGKLSSTRVREVFSWFIKVFREHCSYAFGFTGSFENWVMFSFINYFYFPNKADIWAMLRSVDNARREIEQSVVKEVTLSVPSTEDLQVHDILNNMSVASFWMFRHAGKSKEVNGLMYDIYYFFLCYLCGERVKEINDARGRNVVTFIDPMDRKETKFGFSFNKGIKAKVMNARSLLPYIFNYIRDGKLSTSSLHELRDKCFSLGFNNQEGKNCVWEGYPPKHCLNDVDAIYNFETFGIILRGVESTYTLMCELEARGYSLVDFYYDKMGGGTSTPLLGNADILRHIDYLSALEYIDLISQLQSEPIDKERYGSGLFEFGDMVYHYAGSPESGLTHIRENIYYAITYGFLKNPRIKKTAVPTTSRGRMRSIAVALSAIPRCYDEYIDSLTIADKRPDIIAKWYALPNSKINNNTYRDLNHNLFLCDRPDQAVYYIGENWANTEELRRTLKRYDWHLGTSQIPCIKFANCLGVYLPLESNFLLYCNENGNDSAAMYASWEDFVAVYNSNRNPNNYPNFYGGIIEQKGKFAWVVNGKETTIGFPVLVGINNLCYSQTMKAIDKLEVFGKYKTYAKMYVDLLGKCATIQHSYVDILHTMYVESFSMVTNPTVKHAVDVSSGVGSDFLLGAKTCMFTESSLMAFLNYMHGKSNIKTMDKALDGSANYVPLDLSLLPLIFGDSDNGNFPEFSNAIKHGKTPAEKFVYGYNYLYTTLEFMCYFRDAFSLLCGLVNSDLPAMVCELNNRFDVIHTLRSYAESTGDYGISVDTLSSIEVKNHIRNCRRSVYSMFESLILELCEYVGETERSITDIAPYATSSDTSINSRFDNWGATFAVLDNYPNTDELSRLKSLASVDSAGFFIIDGNYFKCEYAGSTYYVHRSGRLLESKNNTVNAVTFMFNNESDLVFYRNILKAGLNGR